MKKVAIITLYANRNYGNKLQNYALQEILKKRNFDVETIINIPIYNNYKVNKKKAIKYEIMTLFYRLVKGDKKEDILKHDDTPNRKENFLKFNKFINTTNEIFSFSKIDHFNNYDYYFVGSDQVWNPKLGGFSDLDLLTFTNAKKISVSASIGINYIPDNIRDKAKKYLEKFDAISVREFQGKEIINSILPNKNVKVLIDPTMMLSSAEWDSVSKEPVNYNKEKYILCYFLGGISDSRSEMILEFANRNNLKIINLLNKDDIYFSSGPSEFLFLEKNAALILTDSFHSCIFGMIYKTPFVVFDREGKNSNMGSRIDTLLKTFDLENRKFSSNKNLEDYLNIDYKKIDDKIGEKQREFDEFIDKNL